jgi:hypothetical protein
MGITIKPFGATPETKSKSKSLCGFEALQNLVPLALQVGGMEYYRFMRLAFKNAGYKEGVTM